MIERKHLEQQGDIINTTTDTYFAEEVRDAKEKGDILRLINLVFEKSKSRLHFHLGIDNLTNIESFRLRKIVEKSIKQNINNPTDESVARWLSELYGISSFDIPYARIVRDKTTGINYEFYGVEQDRARTKVTELKKVGHEVEDSNYPVISEKFKEFFEGNVKKLIILDLK